MKMVSRMMLEFQNSTKETMRMTGECAKQDINAEQIRERSTTGEKQRGVAVARGESIGDIVIGRRGKGTFSGREIENGTLSGKEIVSETFLERGNESGTFTGMIGRGNTLK